MRPCIHHLLLGFLTGIAAYSVAFSAVQALEARDER
jgi:hypothetical protein